MPDLGGETNQQLAEKWATLAADLRVALDDPKRYEWGDSPWEHLGDAERDVRMLLDERDALLARLNEAEKLARHQAAEIDDFGSDLAAAEAERDRLKAALEHIASLSDISSSAHRRADYLARAVLSAGGDE